MIPCLLRESPLLFFNKNIRQPRILCGVGREPDLDKVLAPKIKIEDVMIGHTDDFVTAFAMLLSTDCFLFYAENYKPAYI